MKATSERRSLELPTALFAEIEAAAAAEHRPTQDVPRDAMTAYQQARRWRDTIAFGTAQAQLLGISEDDVPRLIEEFRREKRQAG